MIYDLHPTGCGQILGRSIGSPKTLPFRKSDICIVQSKERHSEDHVITKVARVKPSIFDAPTSVGWKGRFLGVGPGACTLAQGTHFSHSLRELVGACAWVKVGSGGWLAGLSAIGPPPHGRLVRGLISIVVSEVYCRLLCQLVIVN